MVLVTAFFESDEQSVSDEDAFEHGCAGRPARSRRMHNAIPEQGQWLRAVATGFFAYHAVSTNARASEPEGSHDVGPNDEAR